MRTVSPVVLSVSTADGWLRRVARLRAGLGVAALGLVACVTGHPQPTVNFSGVPQKSVEVSAVEIFQGPPPPRPYQDVGTIEVVCPADAYASGHGGLDVEGSCTMEHALRLAREKLAEVGADGMYAVGTNSMGGGRLTGLTGTAFRYEGGAPKPVARRPPEPAVDPTGKPVVIVHGTGTVIAPTTSPVSPTVSPTPAAAPTGKIPVEERLRRLQELRDKGLISAEDYEKKKAEILRDL
ncbi:MAG: SHOCT domain-containing protein [Polyangia bacterium]